MYAAARKTLERWFKRGLEQGATHFIVVCDTFDYEDYPVYVSPSENVHQKAKEYDGPNMQKVMEVYDLRRDMDEQINSDGLVRNY